MELSVTNKMGNIYTTFDVSMTFYSVPMDQNGMDTGQTDNWTASLHNTAILREGCIITYHYLLTVTSECTKFMYNSCSTWRHNFCGSKH